MEPSPNVITPSSTKEEDTKEEDTNLEGMRKMMIHLIS